MVVALLTTYWVGVDTEVVEIISDFRYTQTLLNTQLIFAEQKINACWNVSFMVTGRML